MRHRPEISTKSMHAAAALVLVSSLSFAAFVIAAPTAQPTPDTLALNDEDAQTCKAKACRTITDGAFNLIAGRIQQLEAQNEQLRAALAKKPNPKYCL